MQVRATHFAVLDANMSDPATHFAVQDARMSDSTTIVVVMDAPVVKCVGGVHKSALRRAGRKLTDGVGIGAS